MLNLHEAKIKPSKRAQPLTQAFPGRNLSLGSTVQTYKTFATRCSMQIVYSCKRMKKKCWKMDLLKQMLIHASRMQLWRTVL